MIFILCFLLHITLIHADTDILQNDNIEDSSSAHTIEKISENDPEDNSDTKEGNETIVEDETTELKEEISESSDTSDEVPLTETEIKDNTNLTDELLMEKIIEISVSDTVENESIDNQINTVTLPKNTIDNNQQKSGICMQTLSSPIMHETQKTQKITVINAITPEKTAYKHWTGTYEPDFIITVAGQSIDMSSQKSVELNSTTMSISYHAQFPAQRSSEDTTTVHVDKSTKTVAIDFDWHTEPRLKITQSS